MKTSDVENFSIPELEEAMKNYGPRETCMDTYSLEQDMILKKYLGKVPKKLILKYFPGKTIGGLKNRKRRILLREKKKAAAGKKTGAPPAHKPVNGLLAKEKTAGGSPDKPKAKKTPDEKKSKPSTRGNARPDAWKDEEKDAIKDCPDQNAAVKRYQKKFPKSNRKPWAIEQRWYILTRDKRAGKTAAPSGQSSDNVITLEWSQEEDAAIRECPNEDMALTHFQNKFPESEKTAVQVSVRWQFLKGNLEEPAEAGGAS